MEHSDALISPASADARSAALPPSGAPESAPIGSAPAAMAATTTRAPSLLRDPRLVQLLIPGSFTVLGQTILHFRVTPQQLLLTWIVCCATEMLLTFRQTGRWPLPLSATITALSLGLLLRTTDLLPFAIAGCAGIASKHLLRIDGRHVFNPSNFGLVLALVLFPDTTHVMVAEWGTSLAILFVLLNCAFFIAYRVRRFHLAIAYLASYALFTAATALGLGANWSSLPPHVANVVSSGAVLVFAFFMITDPKTSPKTTMTRVIYGVLTSAISFILAAQGTDAAMFLALLIVCPFVPQLDRLLGACQWRRPRNLLRLLASAVAVGTVACVASFGASAATVESHLVSGHAVSSLTTNAAPLPAERAMSAAAQRLQNTGLVPHFTDVTAQAGLAMAHHTVLSECQPPLGTGAAWGDYDRDGQMDLYVTDHGGRSHLYHNNGDGTFTDVAVAAGVADPPRPTNGAVWADDNNDGWPDLLVLGNGHNTLYRNNGNGTFTDVTARSGLGKGGRAMSAAWGDYDNDGYLDLYIADYADCIDGPLAQTAGAGGLRGLPTPHSHLYHNNGDGTFTDVTSLLGRQTEGFTYAAAWLDAFGKGPASPDLYVANDFGRSIQPNVLWRNAGPAPRPRGGWRFVDASGPSHTDMAAFAMSTAVGDYDNDGRLDMAVSNIGSIYLYHNDGGGRFHNVAARAGVGRAITPFGSTAVTWGLGWADFNNDGHLDLYEAAGPFSMPMGMLGMPTAGDSPFQPNVLFLNNGDGTFTDVSQASGADIVRNGRTVAFADYDNDGCVDIFVANWGQAPALLHNDAGCGGDMNPNHWLTVELVGTRSNRDGVGAEIVLTARGLPAQLQQIQEGSSLGAGSAREAHFGLGQAPQATSIEVRWPSGAVQTLHHVAADRRIVLVEPGRSRWPSPAAHRR